MQDIAGKNNTKWPHSATGVIPSKPEIPDMIKLRGNNTWTKSKGGEHNNLQKK